MNLRGKTVWLTGASSGIGEALTYELARRGCRVAISSRNELKLSTIAQAVTKATGAEVHTFPADVTDLEAIKNCVERIEQKTGAIDILIANAGTHIFSKPEQFDSKEYMHLMATNYGGMLNTIEAVTAKMISRQTGTIVGMASLAGYRGLPRAAAYGASKAAMIHFLESIRFHLRRKGIRVVICNPGFVKTPLTDKNDFKMPFLISAEEAALSICNGLERDKEKITFPRPFALIMELNRILPYPLYDFYIERIWRRMEPR